MQLPFSREPKWEELKQTPQAQPESTASAAFVPVEIIFDESFSGIGEEDGPAVAMPELGEYVSDGSTPAREDQAETWINDLFEHMSARREKLTDLTRNFDLTKLREEVDKISAWTKEDVVKVFFLRHFRQPDAPADAKKFPIRIEVFYLLLCSVIAVMVIIMLLIVKQ
jgi:hypothetical protein